MQSALSEAMSARNRPPPMGGLFGPEAMMKLALDNRTRHLMEDPEFQGMLRGLNSNPQMLSMYLQDPRFQLVSR